MPPKETYGEEAQKSGGELSLYATAFTRSCRAATSPQWVLCEKGLWLRVPLLLIELRSIRKKGSTLAFRVTVWPRVMSNISITLCFRQLSANIGLLKSFAPTKARNLIYHYQSEAVF